MSGTIPLRLKNIGTISAEEIKNLTDGLFAMDVPVEINRRVFDYDQIIIVGPVFPHEVVGFSGGNKYLFPGVSGPEVLNFFHWLGAVVTNPMIIGNKWTRRCAKSWIAPAAMVTVPQALLLHGGRPRATGGPFRRLTGKRLGRGQRSVPDAPHHLQGASVPHRALVRAADVR